MTAEQYLEQIEAIDMQINQDIRRLEQMRSAAAGTKAIRYDTDPVQTSPDGDRLLLDVAKYIELEKRINAEIDRFIDVKDLIIRQIRGLHTVKNVQFLYLRYVDYMPLEDVSEEMGISYSTVKRIRLNALAEFGDTYQNLKYLT